MNSASHQNDMQWVDQMGQTLAHRLHASPLPHDVTERLRVARQQAVAKASLMQSRARFREKEELAYSAELSSANRSPTSKSSRMWLGLGSAIPLLSLVVGLVYLSGFHSQQWLNEISRIDAALLADELPPDAFTDPGFLAYLKSERNASASNSDASSGESESSEPTDHK